MVNPAVLQHAGRYKLSESDAHALEDELTWTHRAAIDRAQQDGHDLVVLAVDGRLPTADLGRQLEQEIFDADLGDHPVEVMEVEYGGYEDRSIFLLAFDLELQRVAGAARIITGTAGFGPMVKTMRDVVHLSAAGRFEEPNTIDLRAGRPDGIDIELGVLGGAGRRTKWLSRASLENHHNMRPGEVIIDCASIVVADQFRGRRQIYLSAALFAGIWRAGSILNASHWVSMVQLNVFGMLTGGLGLRWSELYGLPPIEYIEGDPELSQAIYHSSSDAREYIETNKGRPTGTFRGGFAALQASSACDSMFSLRH